MAEVPVGTMQHVSLESEDISGSDFPAQDVEAVPMTSYIRRLRKPCIADHGAICLIPAEGVIAVLTSLLYTTFQRCDPRTTCTVISGGE